MSAEEQYTVKHFIFLVIWGLSLAYALFSGNFWVGILLAVLFFLISTFKVILRSIFFMIVVFILTIIFAPLAPIIAAVCGVLFLLKIKFLLDNWRVLLLGIYAYFGYLLVILLNTVTGIFLNVIVAGLVSIILTIIFHKLIVQLYKRGYGTDRVFHIMGLTPLILLSVILPFLKIKIEGVEIFDGSLTDDIGSIDHDISIVSSVSPDLGTALDFADTDIGTLLDIDTPEFVSTVSPAIEASVATAAVHGIYSVAEHLEKSTIRNKDGSELTISYIDEENSVIEEASGRRIGYITLDRENNCEHVRLTNGFKYTIEHATGNIVDTEGKLIGRLKDGDNGTKLLVGKNDEVIREFKADGSIISVST